MIRLLAFMVAALASAACAGPMGSTGETGNSGPTGATGDRGADGASGPVGPTGPMGYPGQNAAPGPTGPAGATGPMGAAGPKGATGPAGPTGAVGPTGPAGGPIGPVGPVGPTGPAGQNYSGTTGSVLYLGANGEIAQDNAELFWNDTTHALGLGTAVPADPLDVVGVAHASGGFASDVGLSTQGFKVQRDILTFNTNGDNATPIHIKTSVPIGGTLNIMYRYVVEGYNYGGAQAIFSDCVGYATTATNGTWEGMACNDYASGATLTQYQSSDGYVTLKLTSGVSFYYAGFSLSAWFLNPTGTAYKATYTVVQQTADLYNRIGLRSG